MIGKGNYEYAIPMVRDHLIDLVLSDDEFLTVIMMI
jgi:hypothetical protein